VQIIGIAGSARAGKTTCANFIVGTKMKSLGMIDEFKIDENGKLFVQADEIQDDDSIINVSREFNAKNNVRNPEFELWAQHDLWPHVKVYSLADPLKFFMMDTFGLTVEQCFGEDKYTEIDMEWDRVQFLPGATKKKGKMTAREGMEVVGSCFIRQVQEDVLVSAALVKMMRELPGIAIVDDVRADFEAAGIQEAGGKVVRLTRGLSKNISEQTIDKIEPDFLLDNDNMSIDEAHAELLATLKGWEYEV
jgi:hypothetical protein